MSPRPPTSAVSALVSISGGWRSAVAATPNRSTRSPIGVAKRKRGGQGVRVEGCENGPEERVPDDDAAADDDDQRVDREPERVAPGGRCPLKHEEGDDDDRVVGDVGNVGHRRGGCAAAKVQPGKCPVAQGVDERCDAHDGPAKANPPVVNAQRSPKDDHCSEQVQPGLADIGNGTPYARVPEAGDEPGDRDAPSACHDGDEDLIEPESAARSPVQTG